MSQVAVIGLTIVFVSISLFLVTRSFIETFSDSRIQDIVSIQNIESMQYMQDVKYLQNVTSYKCGASCCAQGVVTGGLSCSKGCVCLSEEQQDLMGTRGGNRSRGGLY